MKKQIIMILIIFQIFALYPEDTDKQKKDTSDNNQIENKSNDPAKEDIDKIAQVIFIDTIYEKSTISIDDLITIFCYYNDLNPINDYKENLQLLKNNTTIAFIDKFLPPAKLKSEPATFGDFSLLAIQNLDLNGGIFYRLLKNQRYATRELIKIGLLQNNTSEFEKLSGPKLLRYIVKLGEYYEK